METAKVHLRRKEAAAQRDAVRTKELDACEARASRRDGVDPFFKFHGILVIGPRKTPVEPKYLIIRDRVIDVSQPRDCKLVLSLAAFNSFWTDDGGLRIRTSNNAMAE